MHREKLRAALFGAALVFGLASASEGQQVPRIEPPLDPAPLRSGPPVGFVTHPGLIEDSRIDLLSEFPATAELSNVFRWKMKDGAEPEAIDEIDVDFTDSTEWLREIYKSGRVALPILDTGILHSQEAWRAALTDAVGENLVGIDGETRGWSSFHSPVYRRSVFTYINQIIDWVKVNDPAHRIPAYINGAEWFWPWGTMDYSDLAMEAFHRWLETKYRSVDALNEAWGSEFADWHEADSVRAYPTGEWAIGTRTFTLGRPALYSWASPTMEVTPGAVYEASVEVEVEDVPEGLVDMTFAWIDAEGEKIAPWFADAFTLDREHSEGGTISARATAPENAETLRLALKVWGKGRARFSDPEVRSFETGEMLLPADAGPGDGPGEWTFEEMGEANEHFKRDDGTIVLTIEASAPELPYENSSVAHDDWIRFSFESMADWLNLCAQHIKERDPTRKVASYVGWIFGMHSMWDGVQEEQRLDISLANTPDLDINGFQLAIAGDDYTYATFSIDLARKYGKEMWGTDLVDFPYGLLSGFEPIYRASLACVQRGLGGFFYYNWHGPPDEYSYSEHMADTDIDRLVTSVKDGITALEGYELETDVAQLLPILAYSLDDEDGYKGDMLDGGGLYHLVLDMGLTPDIWTPYEIEKLGGDRLLDYRTLFISDCPVLPVEVNQALIDFVEGGGTIIGSGQWPSIDRKKNPLPQLLVDEQAAVDGGEIVSVALGEGKVFWQRAKVGRDYWGKVRRIRIYGNTPSVTIEQPDSERTPEGRRKVRQQIERLLDESNSSRPIRVGLDHGTIHAATWRDDTNGFSKIFLVNRTGGRLYQPKLVLDPTLFHSGAEVWIDMERRRNVTAGPDGAVTLPSFAHSAIVTVKHKE